MQIESLLAFYTFIPVTSINANVIGSPLDKPTRKMCNVCKSLVSSVNFLTQREIFDSAVKNAESICEVYDLGNLTEECYDVVNEFVKGAYNSLVTEFKPETDCALWGFCSSKDSEDDELEIIDLNDSEEKPDDLDTIPRFDRHHRRHPHRHHRHHHPHPHHHRHHPHHHKNICELSLTNVQNMINVYDKNVILALNSMCSYLDVSSTECEQIVNTHLTEFLHQAKTSPSNELCDSLQKHLQNFQSFSVGSLSLQVQVGASSSNKLSGNVACKTCVDTLTKVEQFLKLQNWTELETEFEGYCKVLSDNKNFQIYCLTFFEFAFNELNNYVKKIDFEPKEFCKEIRFCSDKLEFGNIIEDNVDMLDEIFEKLKPFAPKVADFMMKNIN